VERTVAAAVLAGASIAAIAARLGMDDLTAFLMGCGVATLTGFVLHRLRD
jgi:hypothetical protein